MTNSEIGLFNCLRVCDSVQKYCVKLVPELSSFRAGQYYSCSVQARRLPQGKVHADSPQKHILPHFKDNSGVYFGGQPVLIDVGLGVDTSFPCCAIVMPA